MTREELHDLIRGANRILHKEISTRSDTDSLTTLERALLGVPGPSGQAELIAKWRREANGLCATRAERSLGRADGLRTCAEELETYCAGSP